MGEWGNEPWSSELMAHCLIAPLPHCLIAYLSMRP